MRPENRLFHPFPGRFSREKYLRSKKRGQIVGNSEVIRKRGSTISERGRHSVINEPFV
jgi:hypothetical protein